ncbi:hypothetical protein CK203_072544 [Vitis vinifera]|uniref:Uncharacterized protein n=1 Tax=Vitis vinifera TaxID=29760 RepID=A0A438F924_VITVI|nr:hypothetical protein CK203_072544 [Vitis vinifera]
MNTRKLTIWIGFLQEVSMTCPFLLGAWGALPGASSVANRLSYIDLDGMDSTSYEYTSMKSSNESKYGFWGALARKAKAIIEDDNEAQQPEAQQPEHLERTSRQGPGTVTGQHHNQYHSPEGHQKTGAPKIQKGMDVIASSLNYIGGTIGSYFLLFISKQMSISTNNLTFTDVLDLATMLLLPFKEGRTIVENRTADIIQETRKLHIRKKGSGSEPKHQATNIYTRKQTSMQAQMEPQLQADQEIQLKASRDVAMAMAAKAKLLLRELKTVKADLAFAKERCAQLEEENRILREHHEKGDNPEDDDLIRLQLETLLAEKARLAQENSVYARENRFLREIVEYHQLTMQDVIYLDERTEEVTEVYPIKVPTVNNLHSVATTLPPLASSLPFEGGPKTSPQGIQHVSTAPVPPQALAEISQSVASQNLHIPVPVVEDSKRDSNPSA